MNVAFLPLGIAFGVILSRAGATTYDFYAKLFLLQDLQLLWVIAVAGAVGALGVRLIRRRKNKRALLGGAELAMKGKPYTRTLIAGSLIFGVGWGIAGACPGTALAMLGEGKLGSLFTLAGIVAGTAIYGRLQRRAASTA